MSQPTGQGAPWKPLGLDGMFFEIVHRLPGFGGCFLDENGDLNVYLKDLSREAAARTMLADFAQRRPERWHQPWTRPAHIIVRQAKFDFSELQGVRWRLVGEVAGIRGVHMFDTDEVTNSVVVGVATEEARQAVLVRIATLNLPLSAVAVEVLPQAEYATTLLDQNIPTSGGVAIQWPENLAQQCTLGVNVWYAYQAYGIPAGTEGFYTASHCSQNQGNMSGHTWLGNTDNTPYYQHGVRIGTEGFDPPLFWEPACQYSVPFPYLNCRNSDVTFVRYDYSGMASHGYIEQTLFPGFGVGQPGSIDIASPSFTITSTACCPLAGYMVDKVGWATGWTEGFVRSRGVDRTCADMITSDSNTYILCSYEASAFAGAGDSGAPVFQLLGNYNVAFTGIVWARSGDGRFWFSDISQIAKDMGTAVNYLRY